MSQPKHQGQPEIADRHTPARSVSPASAVGWSDPACLGEVLGRVVSSAEPAVVFASVAAAAVPALARACSIMVVDDEHAAFEIRYPVDGGVHDRDAAGTVLVSVDVGDHALAGEPGYAVTADFHVDPACVSETTSADMIRAVASLLVRAATHLVREGRLEAALDTQAGRAENLTVALQTSRGIGQAIGILMSSQQLTAKQAFQALRSVSRHTHRKLHDLADDVAESGMLDVPRALDIIEKHTSDGTDVCLAGELDAATAYMVTGVAGRIAAVRSARVRYDLSQLTFCDIAGLDALLAARNRVISAGGDFSIVGARGVPLKLLRITRTADLLCG